MTDKKVPHIHAELIKAWAYGAEIEFFDGREWISIQRPSWVEKYQYRVKPEPKPDIVVYQTLRLSPERHRVVSYIETTERFCTDNVMFVFDGETGALKDCQILAKE